MDTSQKIWQLLNEIEIEMRELSEWQSAPPQAAAFTSNEPFCLDSMTPYEWLQWMLLPKMKALLDSETALPGRFMISPYFEETLLEQHFSLLLLLRRLDALLNKDPL